MVRIGANAQKPQLRFKLVARTHKKKVLTFAKSNISGFVIEKYTKI